MHTARFCNKTLGCRVNYYPNTVIHSASVSENRWSTYRVTNATLPRWLEINLQTIAGHAQFSTCSCDSGLLLQITPSSTAEKGELTSLLSLCLDYYCKENKTEIIGLIVTAFKLRIRSFKKIIKRSFLVILLLAPSLSCMEMERKSKPTRADPHVQRHLRNLKINPVHIFLHFHGDNM